MQTCRLLWKFGVLFLTAAAQVLFVNCSGFDMPLLEDSRQFMAAHAVLAPSVAMQRLSDSSQPCPGQSNTPTEDRNAQLTMSCPPPPATPNSDPNSNPGTNTASLPTPTTSPATAPSPTPSPSDVQASFICSNYFSNASGTNLVFANRTGQALAIAYLDSNDAVHCQQSLNLQTLLSTRTVTLPACAELAGKVVALAISTGTPAPPPKSLANGPTYTTVSHTLLAPHNMPMYDFKGVLATHDMSLEYDKVQFDFKGTPSLVPHEQFNFQRLEHLSAEDSGKLQIIYALNRQMNAIPSGFTNLDLGDQANCSGTASPLVLQLPPPGVSPEPLALSSIESGVRYDILGENAFPTAHEKLPISWLVQGSRTHNYFLTLPAENGQVNGIDELFGDNTKGPDGTFAANGYEALRKFDGNRGNLPRSTNTMFARSA